MDWNYDKNTRDLALEELNIYDVGPILVRLAAFPNLTKLSLARNNISTLPEDLSTSIPNVKTLDLRDNPIGSVHDVLQGLSSLKNLRHLYITLPEDEEERLIVTLTKLESLNGTSLTDGAEAAESDEHKQMQEQFRSSSISGSNGDDREQEFPEVNLLMRSREVDSYEGPFAIQNTISKEDLDAARKLYRQAVQLVGRDEDTKTNDFNNLINRITSNLHKSHSGDADPLKQTAAVLHSKRLLFDKCFDELIRFSYRLDVNFSNSLQEARNKYQDLLDQYAGLSVTMHNDYMKKMVKMQHNLDAADKEIGLLLESAEMLKEDAKRNEELKKKMAEEYEREREHLIEELGWLRAENEKMQNRMRQYELNRQKVMNQINLSPTSLSQQNGYFMDFHNGSESQNNTPRRHGSNTSTPTSGGGNPNNNNHTPGSNPAIMKSTRTLTLRQIKEIIEDIYASKAKFDQKCTEARLPRETMEQHLYTYLNQKYGLKNLILDWASAIIQAVKTYSSEDNDVAVFGKILRNDIDEEFRFVQRQLRETVAELLRIYLKNKYPMKVESEITAHLQKRMTGYVYEEEWVDIVKYMYNQEDSVNVIMKVREAIRVAQQSNAAELARNSAPSTRAAAQQQSGANPKHQNKIPYIDFVNVLLDFQLKGHERFLHKFVKLFRQFDEDRNGIINEDEFRGLLLRMDPDKKEEDIEYLLNEIDPYNNKKITFSECVSFLSTELVRMMTERQAL